jgi:hypothetical protein
LQYKIKKIMADDKNLNDLAFKNEAAKTILALKNENLRLKDNYGRRGNMSSNDSEVGKIQGLQGLKPRLGKQFTKGTLEDLMD